MEPAIDLAEAVSEKLDELLILGGSHELISTSAAD
jgi:hypothetical protein